MLSINGSPLANPWSTRSTQDGGDEEGEGPVRTLQRSKSSIIVRRDPSVQPDSWSLFPSSQPPESATHSRTNSQSSQASSSQLFTSNSQSYSQSTFTFPNHSQPLPTSHSHSQTPRFPSNSQPLPIAHSHSGPFPQTPRHPSVPKARIALPTKDGHFLDFDALEASPGELDRLEGISDSAKKEAREEIQRLVWEAGVRWRIAP